MSVVVLNFAYNPFMLTVVMLNVIMLNVVAPFSAVNFKSILYLYKLARNDRSKEIVLYKLETIFSWRVICLSKANANSILNSPVWLWLLTVPMQLCSRYPASHDVECF